MAQNNDNTFFLNSGLFPCVCVGMYDSPLGPDSFEESMNNALAGDPDEEFSFYEVSFSDWCKELTLQAGEYINDNIIEPLTNYGVLSIEATGVWSPKYYNYSNDQLEMTVTMSDDWRGINAYRSFEEGEEYTDEELAAMSDEEREELYDSLVEPIVDEFTKQNLQTQCFDYNFYATEVTLNELNEDGIR